MGIRTRAARAAAFGAGVLTLLLGTTALHAETLKDALSKAYSTNPELQAERANLRATDEEVPQALAGWRPTVSVAGEAGGEHIDSNSESADLIPRSVQLNIVQPLYRGGRTVADTERAESVVAAGRAQLSATEQTVLLNAVRAYMDVLQAKAVLDLNINNLERLQRQLQASRDRFRVGEVTRTDVSQSEAAVAQAEASRTQAEGALANARATYRTVIGDYPDNLQRPAIKLDLPTSVEEAQTLAIAHNPNVIRARNLVDAARHSVRLVTGELLPELSLRGSVGTEDETTITAGSRNTAQLLAELTVPLYQAGAVYSRLRAAKETLSQRREELDSARRAARDQATSAWNNWVTSRATVTSFQSAVKSNAIALEGVQREALVGSRTVLDVLDAEQALLLSKVNLVQAQRDEVVAAFELKSAAGGLTAQNLALPVNYYNPKANYHDVRDQWFGASKPGIPLKKTSQD